MTQLMSDAPSSGLGVRRAAASMPTTQVPRTASAVGAAGAAGAASSSSHPGVDEAVELLARAIHGRYLEHELAQHHQPGSRPGLRPWAELPEVLRDANRDQAANYESLLRDRNWIVTSARGSGAPIWFSAAEIEELARAEHDRWCRHKKRQGYSYGPVRNDSEPDRRHPSMVAWEALTEEDRERDRDAIRNMPAVLALADLRISRRSAA